MLSDDNSEDLYQVEKIVKKRIDEKGRELYYVKWYGYPEEANTWELAENLPNIDLVVKAFESQQINQQPNGINKKIKDKESSEVNFQHLQNKTLINNSYMPSKKVMKTEAKINDFNKNLVVKETEIIDLTDETPLGNIIPPSQVSLEIDTPYCVKVIKKTNHGTFAEIEWMPRSDGITPNNTLISYKTVKENYPQLLIDFYEDRILTNRTKISRK
jgi:hypothetical protein